MITKLNIKNFTPINEYELIGIVLDKKHNNELWFNYSTDYLIGLAKNSIDMVKNKFEYIIKNGKINQSDELSMWFKLEWDDEYVCLPILQESTTLEKLSYWKICIIQKFIHNIINKLIKLYL